MTSGILAFGKLKIAATVLGVVVASLVGAVALGAVGAPSVEDVDNRFGDVTEETTIIHTDLVVNNPNPIDIQLGNTTINYTVRMNDVPIAAGNRTGLDLQQGNSTLAFRTAMDNEQIPPWWRTHIENGERTAVNINATVQTSILGERQFDITQKREVETDLIGQFNSEETRPVNADDPPPVMSNPVLYVNRTSAEWGTVTREETPIDMAFQLYNPQTLPYTISELGYEITMNGVLVGEGQTEDIAAIPPGATETVRTDAAIINGNLDEWWVTHLQNDQRTQLRIEFYAVISGEELVSDVRVPLDELTYEETIETDIFGNKNASTAPNGSQSTPTPTPTDGTPTPATTPTETDDGVFETPTPVTEETATESETATPTETDDGIGI
jgi:LEA14-like dessication related protein